MGGVLLSASAQFDDFLTPVQPSELCADDEKCNGRENRGDSNSKRTCIAYESGCSVQSENLLCDDEVVFLHKNVDWPTWKKKKLASHEYKIRRYADVCVIAMGMFAYDIEAHPGTLVSFSRIIFLFPVPHQDTNNWEYCRTVYFSHHRHLLAPRGEQIFCKRDILEMHVFFAFQGPAGQWNIRSRLMEPSLSLLRRTSSL
jgi:hypothetical protein